MIRMSTLMLALALASLGLALFSLSGEADRSATMAPDPRIQR